MEKLSLYDYFFIPSVLGKILQVRRRRLSHSRNYASIAEMHTGRLRKQGNHLSE